MDGLKMARCGNERPRHLRNARRHIYERRNVAGRGRTAGRTGTHRHHRRRNDAIADFPGNFGWGYDGVDLFAPFHLYGTPDDLRQFVDRAHSLDLAVILDVVYNHFGQTEIILRFISNDYLIREQETDWAIQLISMARTRRRSEFYITNGRYWIDEFHFDGFRFDATDAIHDKSDDTSLARLAGPPAKPLLRARSS